MYKEDTDLISHWNLVRPVNSQCMCRLQHTVDDFHTVFLILTVVLLSCETKLIDLVIEKKPKQPDCLVEPLLEQKWFTFHITEKKQ